MAGPQPPQAASLPLSPASPPASPPPSPPPGPTTTAAPTAATTTTAVTRIHAVAGSRRFACSSRLLFPPSLSDVERRQFNRRGGLRSFRRLIAKYRFVPDNTPDHLGAIVIQNPNLPAHRRVVMIRKHKRPAAENEDRSSRKEGDSVLVFLTLHYLRLDPPFCFPVGLQVGDESPVRDGKRRGKGQQRVKRTVSGGGYGADHEQGQGEEDEEEDDDHNDGSGLVCVTIDSTAASSWIRPTSNPKAPHSTLALTGLDSVNARISIRTSSGPRLVPIVASTTRPTALLHDEADRTDPNQLLATALSETTPGDAVISLGVGTNTDDQPKPPFPTSSFDDCSNPAGLFGCALANCRIVPAVHFGRNCLPVGPIEQVNQADESVKGPFIAFYHPADLDRLTSRHPDRTDGISPISWLHHRPETAVSVAFRPLGLDPWFLAVNDVRVFSNLVAPAPSSPPPPPPPSYTTAPSLKPRPGRIRPSARLTKIHRATIDTTTPLILLSTESCWKIYDAVPNATFDSALQSWIFPLKRTLPNVQSSTCSSPSPSSTPSTSSSSASLSSLSKSNRNDESVNVSDIQSETPDKFLIEICLGTSLQSEDDTNTDDPLTLSLSLSDLAYDRVCPPVSSGFEFQPIPSRNQDINGNINQNHYDQHHQIDAILQDRDYDWFIGTVQSRGDLPFDVLGIMAFRSQSIVFDHRRRRIGFF